MSKLPTVHTVHSPLTTPIAPPMSVTPVAVLTLTKVRECDGKAVETTILSNAVEGVEPSSVTFKGKQYAGIKVYTKTGWFKALNTPESFANGAAYAFKSGQAVKLTGKAPLLLGKGK